MPPTRPLATNCRYGLQCTRADCYYMHPKGRDMKQTCYFGRSCFRKVCHLNHPEGRMMDQLRANVDYCAACTLVRPAELPKVSAAFEAAFPAANDGKDRCDFVAAVPMSVAFRDWKTFRGITSTGTPDGVPSTPEKIRLFPRTRTGEQLLQDASVRQGMRWSPTPYRPWKTLERMASHDQHWDENQDMYVLCAGYEDTSRAKGVCIELSVTGTVKTEDDGDGIKAGTRVAKEILGLPGASSQTWFVFHVSRPEESDGEAQFVTVKAIVEVAKLPAVKAPAIKLQAGKSPASASSSSPPLAPAAFTFPPRPPPATPPQASRPAPSQQGTPPSVGRIPTASPSTPTIRVGSASLGPAVAAPVTAATTTTGSHWPTAIGSPIGAPQSGQQRNDSASSAHAPLPPPPPPPPSSSAPASSDSELGSSLSFGAYVDEATAALAIAPLLLAAPGSAVFGGRGSDNEVRVVGARSMQVATASSPRMLGGIEEAMTAMVAPPRVAAPVEDDLSKLLVRLNMSKFRSKFDSKQVDYGTLTTLTEEHELSGLGIPLGPRIKLMHELGIHRLST